MKKLLQWGVSLGLLGALIALVDVGAVYRALRSAHPLYLALGVLLMAADRLLMAAKWLPLLRIHHPELPAGRAVRSYFAATFAALLLPATIGGDALRAYGVGRDRDSHISVGASVVLERVLGLMGSGVMALVALWLAIRADIPLGFLLPWAAGCILAGAVATALPFSSTARRGLRWSLSHFRGRSWVSYVKRFGSAYGVYRGHERTLAGVAVLSVLEQLMPVLVFWMAAMAIDLPVTLEPLLVSVPLSMFVARIPIGVAGLGLLEGGLVYFLGLYGIPAAQAVSLALAGRFVNFVAVLPGALWWGELTGRPSVTSGRPPP